MITQDLGRSLRLDSPTQGLMLDDQLLSYRQVSALFDEFDHKIAAAVGDLKSVSCGYLKIDNSASSAIILMYFLDRQITFFAGREEANRLPGFCGYVVEPSKTKHDDFNITRNPMAATDQQEIAPNLAFFQSSGSTGKPKYICYEQHELLQNGGNICKRFDLTETDRVMVPVPINHMFGFGVGLLPALLSQASVKIIAKTNVVRLFEQLQHMQPTFSLTTPSLIKMLNMLGKKNKVHDTQFISAGDSLFKDVHDTFVSSYGKLANLYGCTELGAIAISQDDPAEDIVPVVPLPQVALGVTDGDKGEIWVNHPHGFSYYADENGQPKEGNTQVGRYHSNDLGHMIAPDLVAVLGRMDSCVNRYGFLVAGKEIESELYKILPEADQLLVIVLDEQGMAGNKVVAFFQTKMDEKALRQKINSHLPPKFRPDECVVLSKLPTLPNGKPDKVLLKANHNSKH